MSEAVKKNEKAITVSHIEKIYKLYDRRSDRLREALLPMAKKRHKDHYALKDVSFDVGTGECVGIIGTNGSGKSTILKIITGVLTPTAGTVEINGRISALLELGAGFNPEYNGIENIYLNGMMIGFSREEIDKKLDAILEFADIGDYVYQPVKTYSSGMFVRLAFALSINIDPEILIVDEALSVGDVFFQAKCYHKFEEFKEQGKTILFVSHDMSSISKYCDRVVLLDKGTKLAEGDSKKVIDIYKQVLVGQYKAEESVMEDTVKSTGENAAGNKAEPSEKKADESNKENNSKKNKKNRRKNKKKKGSQNDSGKDLNKAAETDNAKSDNTSSENETSVSSGPSNLEKDTLEYGSGKATITDVYLTDENDRKVNAVVKESYYTIHMNVSFSQECPAPIFAYTIKDVKGTDITGTNTMYEKAFLSSVKAGEKKIITFRQKMMLQGGNYLVSFGVTGFENENFTVYHRLYDAIAMEVISDKNTVGYFDPGSEVKVE
ncbi:MAG: ABC transporter ATP-binding protein [Lachnospiraceae bacterium]|nr:ABC transporter ATP-binding protein [Lachnospiraceae bacterium]